MQNSDKCYEEMNSRKKGIRNAGVRWGAVAVILNRSKATQGG